jgi:ectoine hydroxylase-related dioxygenase (phytanoyl-CoA dioxygenase family)
VAQGKQKTENRRDTCLNHFKKDSDYYGQMELQSEPTIACWTALDAVDQINGTVTIGSLADKIATKVVTAPAGSVLFMSSKLLHHSTGNSSDKFRRAYMPQYSLKPLLYPNREARPLSQQCIGLAVKSFK